MQNLNSNMELLILYPTPSLSISTILFKFQYGATNIITIRIFFVFVPPFKFQYGATNIFSLMFPSNNSTYLNSNMELLI